MTIQGAIAELQNLINADDVPHYYNGCIEKVIETILMELPTIEVSEDAVSREYVVKKLKSTKEFYLSAWESFSNMDDKDKARCDELNNCIATVINAPSVIPTAKEGEWELSSDDDGEYGICSICGNDADFTQA